MKKLVILGAGGYANTVRDVAEQLGYEIIAMLDDRFPDRPPSTFSDYISDDVEFIPAFGNNEFRLQWIEKVRAEHGKIATLIHSTAYVSPKVDIAYGTVILPMACVNTGTSISRGCIINVGALIDHDCVIEEGCHICLGAIVKGENRIKRCEKVEAGMVIERAAMK